MSGSPASKRPRIRSRERPAVRRLPLTTLVLQFPIAVAKGAAAEQLGRSPKTNPYPKGTDESHAWAAGWYASRKDRS